MLRILPLLILLATGCVSLTSEDVSRTFTSREYPLPKAMVYQGVLAVMKMYPMGIDIADEQRGLVRTNTGLAGTMMIGAQVGYRVQAEIAAVSDTQTKVTPFFWMNVSNEPLKPNEVPIPATHNYRRYEDFYEALEGKLSLPAARP